MTRLVGGCPHLLGGAQHPRPTRRLPSCARGLVPPVDGPLGVKERLIGSTAHRRWTCPSVWAHTGSRLTVTVC